MTNTAADLRCGNCDYWLGESSTALVQVGVVARAKDTTIHPPRDLRLCKACGQVTVFVAQSDLEAKLREGVA